MKKIIAFILSMIIIFYVFNLLYNAEFNNQPLNLIASVILIGSVIHIIFLLVKDISNNKRGDY